jgi:PAS domain S-box-containing protein
LVAAALTAGSVVWGHWLDPALAVGMLPITGVVLAALLLLTPRHWVFPLAASTVAVTGTGLLYGADGATAAAPAAGAVVGAIVGACALRAYARGDFALRDVADVGALAVLGAGLGAFIGAATAVAVTAVGHGVDDYWDAVSRQGVASAFGVLIAATVVLAWARRPDPPLPGNLTEAAVLAATVLAAAVLAFNVWSDPLAYGAVVLLVWAAIRFRLRGVATGALVMALVADWSITRGDGPLTDIGQSPRSTLLIFQTFAAVSFLAFLFLAAALDQRDRAAAHRRVAADQFRRTFDSTPVGMALTTLDGVITDANPALCEIFGVARRDLVGTTLDQRRDTDDRSGEMELAAFSARGMASFVATGQRFVAADGAVVWAEVSDSLVRGIDGNADSRVVMVHDVTRVKSLEEQLLHSQKMQAVGRLAGDVAHDFNNLLAVMRGHAEMLDDDLRVLGQARNRLASMQHAAERAAALTEDLLSYSRRRTDAPDIIDIHSVIGGAHEMLLQLLGDRVMMELVLDARATTVLADPYRVEQVLVNLVVNARDAMPGGGHLTIATQNPVDTDERQGPVIELRVCDTGIGMNAETQRKIFEPFFTTKPPGAGTGLGLSTALKVVRDSGGTMSVESEPGAGTTFVVTLPLSVIDVRPETILVVDDEPEVRSVVVDMLRDSGYQLLEADNAERALDLVSTADRGIDLVVSDVVMPGVGGPELAERIHAQSPDTEILFVSGYTEIAPTAPALRGATLLRKPLARDELLHEVDVALDERARRLKARSGTRPPGR